jgi:hypothetical protein
LKAQSDIYKLQINAAKNLPSNRLAVLGRKLLGGLQYNTSVAEAYTTQPNRKAGSRVLYVYLACMAG